MAESGDKSGDIISDKSGDKSVQTNELNSDCMTGLHLCALIFKYIAHRFLFAPFRLTKNLQTVQTCFVLSEVV